MNYYNEIKKELIDNEVYKRIKDYSKNRYELERYYNVGKLLVEAQGGEARAKYGDGLIKEYSRRLSKELGKGYSYRTLNYMRKFYLFQKVQPSVAQLSWTHYTIILSINDINKMKYYVNQCVIYNLSKRKLLERIKANEYERLDEDTRDNLSIGKDKNEIKNYIKHPIMIKNRYTNIDITEKMLKNLILEDMDSFLKELGNGFCYIENEYKIRFGNTYNYIDILLFNYIYNCFVVVELKVTELKKEHIGQIQVYMNYIDSNVKKINHDKTVGIIIAKRDNKFVMEYCSNNKILRTTYELV